MVLLSIGGLPVMKRLMKHHADTTTNLDIKPRFTIEALSLSIILPLIRLWTGKVNDENLCPST